MKIRKSIIWIVLISICFLALIIFGVFQFTNGNQPSTTTTTTEKINQIKIPDIKNVDIDTAKTLLASKGLIPRIEYEYSNICNYNSVIRTEPKIGSLVEENAAITLYVCKGYKHYELSDAVGYMKNIVGVNAFSFGDDGKARTKGFYTPYVEEGYLYIKMFLACTSTYPLEFYGDFGTASITDTFDKTVPIKVIYDNKTVDNKGKTTYFTVKIPLENLDVQKPTNIYIEFDFTVNGTRRTFEAGFDLSW